MFESDNADHEPPEWLSEPPPMGVFDALTDPSGSAAAVSTAVPGAAATAVLALLDPERLDAAGRVDLLVGIERQLAWLAGLQQRVLASMHAQRGETSDPMGRDWTQEDVACALRLSGPTAQARLDVAVTLTSRLADTLAMLEAGEISYLHARCLADAVEPVDDEAARRIEAQVHRRAGEQTVGQFRRSVARAVLAADPRDADQRHTDAMARRRVCVTPLPDGMASLWALLPAEGAAAIMAAVNALAAGTCAGDERTADQRRADALVDLAASALHDPSLPKAQGLRPAVQVTIALSTLLDLDDAPGELAGYGPIPATVARRIAADPTGTWRRLVLDPVSGQVVDYARRTYRPPADLRRLVIARDQTCVFPSCGRRAEHCDLDHRIRHVDGGETSELNMQALCPRHHPAKDDAGWRVEPHPRRWVQVDRTHRPPLPHPPARLPEA